jgi:hypothetical protein
MQKAIFLAPLNLQRKKQSETSERERKSEAVRLQNEVQHKKNPFNSENIFCFFFLCCSFLNLCVLPFTAKMQLALAQTFFLAVLYDDIGL